MKLTWKLTVFLVHGTLAVTAAHAAYRIRREVGSFEADIRQDNDLLGRAVAAAARRMYETAGEAPALELVKEANERETQVGIRWVWLDAAGDDPHAPLLPAAQLAPVRAGEDLSVKQGRSPAGGRRLTYVPVDGGLAPARGHRAQRAPHPPAGLYPGDHLPRDLAGRPHGRRGAHPDVDRGRPHRRAPPRGPGGEDPPHRCRGDFSGAIPVRGRDELARLGRAMNRMSEQLGRPRPP